MSKIFVRERHRVGAGEGMPRFAIVATIGTDAKIYQMHIRRLELEHLAREIGAEIVYLPRGEHAEAGEEGRPKGAGRRRQRRIQEA